MKWFWSVFTVCLPLVTNAQYVFKGQVSDTYKNQPVYLSLVDDYRKSARVYIDQIIQTTTADSLGFFNFQGNSLPQKNRIYRIHVDGCEEGVLAKSHFLKECPTTESLVFIANNQDTVNIPLLSGQAFCDISSTNVASGTLLDIEVLKEEMILDVLDSETTLARNLKFSKWFDILHSYAQDSDEPLAELLVYSFLSNRPNETFEAYDAYSTKKTHLPKLAVALNTKYPDSKYTSQLSREITFDAQHVAQPKNKTFWSNYKVLTGLTLLILLSSVVYLARKKRVKNAGYATLSPQEKKVCDAILEGKTNNEIATEFFISLSTVKSHVNNIYKKLGVTSRQELKEKL